MLPPERFPRFTVHPPPRPPGILLWDGGCGFCGKSLKIMDLFAKRPVPNEPRQQFEPDLPDTGEQILWVDQHGAVSGGTLAIAAALACAGRTAAAAVLRLPLLNLAFRVFYQIIARNRHWLGGVSCRTSRR